MLVFSSTYSSNYSHILGFVIPIFTLHLKLILFFSIHMIYVRNLSLSYSLLTSNMSISETAREEQDKQGLRIFTSVVMSVSY